MVQFLKFAKFPETWRELNKPNSCNNFNIFGADLRYRGNKVLSLSIDTSSSVRISFFVSNLIDFFFNFFFLRELSEMGL